MDMKKTITKQQQSYINELLKKRREREINKMLDIKKRQMEKQQRDLTNEAMWESYTHI